MNLSREPDRLRLKSYDDKYRGRGGVVNEIPRKFVSRVRQRSRPGFTAFLVLQVVGSVDQGKKELGPLSIRDSGIVLRLDRRLRLQ